MKFPKTVPSSGIDGARMSQVIFDYARSVEALCNQLISGPFDLKVYNSLIHQAQLLQHEMSLVNSAQEKQAIVASVTQEFRRRIGREVAVADVQTMLRSLKEALDIFVPLAIADQPKETTYGALLIHTRDAFNKIVGIVLDPAPASSMTLVQNLREAFES